MCEKVAARSAEAKCSCNHVQSDLAVLPMIQEAGDIVACSGNMFFEVFEQRDSPRKIDWATVIRVYKPQVPKFRALIKIRNAGERNLDESLRQSIQGPVKRDSRHEFEEIAQKVVLVRWLKNAADESCHRLFVRYVGHIPLGMHHGLSNGLDHVVL